MLSDLVEANRITPQFTGIFQGGFTTLLREFVGNVVFFSTYEYVRYQMHLQLKGASSESNQLVDVGVGIMSGGLGGIAVCILLLHSITYSNAQPFCFDHIDLNFFL